MRLFNVCIYVIPALGIQMKRRAGWSSHVLLFSIAQQALVGQGVLIIEASLSNSDTPHTTGLLWTSDRLDVESSTWHHTTLTRNIHTPGGIQTRNLSKRAAADPRLRPRGHWDWLILRIPFTITWLDVEALASFSVGDGQWWEWHVVRIMSPIKVL